MFDFNAPESSSYNAGRKSALDARLRRKFDLYSVTADIPPAAGLIGNALWFNGRALWAETDIGIAGLGTGSFTIRLWCKFNNNLGWTKTMLMSGPTPSYGTGFQLSESFISGPGPSVRKITWRVKSTGGVDNDVIWVGTPTVPINDGNWHRFVLWYDHDGLEIAGLLDNDAPMTTAMAGPIVVPADSYGLVVGDITGFVNPDQNQFYDEVGVWPGRVWTPTEIDDDWNDGAGWGLAEARTIPGMAAYWRMEPGDAFFSVDNPPENLGVLGRPSGVNDVA